MKRAALIVSLCYFSYAFAQPGGNSSTSHSSSTTHSPGNGGGANKLLPASLYADIFAYWDSSSATLEGTSGTQSLSQEGFGLTIAPIFDGFFLGLGSDYRMIGNAKAPSSTVGSLKGTRWAPVELAAGYTMRGWFEFKAEWQPMGAYHLTQPTYQGASVTYQAGSGYRVSLLYDLGLGFRFGPSYESLTFTTRMDSTNGEIPNQGLTMTQLGLLGLYTF